MASDIIPTAWLSFQVRIPYAGGSDSDQRAQEHENGARTSLELSGWSSTPSSLWHISSLVNADSFKPFGLHSGPQQEESDSKRLQLSLVCTPVIQFLPMSSEGHLHKPSD